MLGYGPPPAEEAEAFLESRMHPEDRPAYDALQARLRQCSEGSEQAVELRVRGADGSWRYILCRGRCTERNPDGSARRTIGVHTDLTARRHAEEEQARLQRELHQAHKMEALGQLAGGIAHDFNNILASILGFTELARLRLDGDPGTIGGYLGEVEKAGQRARDLVRKMLLFSRTQEPVAGDAVDVSATVTDSLGMLRPILPSSIDMETDLAEGLPPVAISSVTLQQILTNLCVNARDAMDGKGRLQIRTGLARGRGEECDACSQKVEGEWVEIAVADSGPGISPEAVSRIFDPFYTTKAAGVGTGLGLAVVHGILRTHGGHVLVESRPGQGATFRLLLPPMGGTADPVPEAPMEPVEHHSHDQHIMVIDDEPALRDYLYELLTLHGYRVSTWADPAAALAHLEGDGADVDLLLTDQTMPHMTGLELATRVRGLRPRLPLVLITGYSDEVDSRRGSGLPVDRLLPKPVGSTELLAALDELLARASAS
jgi:signal transduction histidine kinase/ActR/RegA family two-component response regulator